MKCEDCEYEPVCFPALKVANKIGYKCGQGRRKREYKTKPKTLKDVIAAVQLPRRDDAPSNSGTPVPPV